MALFPLMRSVSRMLFGGKPGVKGYAVILFRFKVMYFSLCAAEKSGQEATLHSSMSSLANLEYVWNSSVKFMLDMSM